MDSVKSTWKELGICGLVGIMSSNMLMKHKDALSSLLYLDTWRGRDSTGVAALRHNADTHILKSTVPGYEFVEGEKLEHHLRLNDFLWIGHNRFGTVGRNIKTNAHPFAIDDEDGGCLVVGAHNGTLKNKFVLKDHAQFGTDSEAMFNNIANEGLETTINKLDGAWAITYYDHVVEEFRVIRNKERPLYYAFEEGRKTLMWASEPWMLQVVSSKHNIKLEEGKVVSFNEDTLYSMPAPININEVLSFNRKGGITGKEPTGFFQQGNWRNGEWIGGRVQQQQQPQTLQTPKEAPQTTAAASQTTGLKSGTTLLSSGVTPTNTNVVSSPSTSASKSVNNVVPIKDGKTYKGFEGAPLSKEELEKHLEDGCGWCEETEIKITDKAYGWLKEGVPVCSKCLSGEQDDQAVIKLAINGLGAGAKKRHTHH